MSLRKVMRETLSEWMKGGGPHADIVLSSRVRLARNIDGLPFPHRAEEDDLRRIIEGVDGILSGQNDLGSFQLVKMGSLSGIERKLLVEKHLISPQMAENRWLSALELRDDEAVSVMLNEEDHIRIQCILSGLQLDEALRLSNGLDDLLESKLNYAFSPTFGHLTACPTNVGTGLRVSIMVHLPALVMTRQSKKLISAVNKLGLAVRGLYGEGSEATGNIYQISNQITLGHSEQEIVDNIRGVASQVIERETRARDMLYQENKAQVIDRVWRAYGILSNARIISTEEAMELASEVRLGIDLGIIGDLEGQVLNELMVFIRPAYLQWIEREELSAFERDIKRADLIRERLSAGTT